MARLQLPVQRRGRKTEADWADMKAFADGLLEFESTLDFKISARGWCYHLENLGLIRKGAFSYVEGLINQCRKKGFLPVDFTAADEGRRWDYVDYEREFPYASMEKYAESKLTQLLDLHKTYAYTSFWEPQDHYVQMLVEKVDLVSLFAPVCRKYHIPLSNAKGWSSINQRVFMMRRFKEMEAKGKQCVLLYCGDFDDVGLQISETLQKNLEDLERAAGWSPDALTIDRFGLNFDFIEEQGLTWIDYVETGSGKKVRTDIEPAKSYVRDYGLRKVEANALVARPDAGRALCEEAITKYLGDPLFVYEQREREDEDALKRVLERADYYRRIQDVIDTLNSGE